MSCNYVNKGDLMKKSVKYLAALAVMAAVAVTSIPHIEAEAKRIAELKSEREQLSKQTEDAQRKLKEAQANKADVEAEINAMDDVLNAAQHELDEAQKALDEVNERLEKSEEALENASEKREQQFITFAGRIKFFYENSRISYLDILLHSENFADMIRRIQYIDDIMNYDNNMLEDLSATQEEIKKRTNEIKEEKEQIEYLFEVSQKKMDDLSSIVAQKEALIASYTKDAAKYNQMIANLEAADREAEALIKALSDGTSRASTYSGGQLLWPVPSKSPSSSSLSSGYVVRNKPIGKGTEKHTGYDIPASYGAAVVAAESGTVIYAGWMNGYGNTIMIDHGSNLVTLYAHNSSLTVSKGDNVSRGEQVAKIGSTGNSTGNHCHFEVRVNGAHTNPEPYLGVANVNY